MPRQIAAIIEAEYVDLVAAGSKRFRFTAHKNEVSTGEQARGDEKNTKRLPPELGFFEHAAECGFAVTAARKR